MKKINVLQITQSLGGGVQKYIIQLCNHLDRNRFNITGICALSPEENTGKGDIPFGEAFAQAGVPYFSVPMQRPISLWKDFVSLVKIYQKIKPGRFDIVHAHSSKAGVLARVAARLAQVPVVIYSPHAFSFDGPQPVLKKIFFIFFEKIASLFCDAIIVDSPSEKELALQFKICREKKITIVSPSIKPIDYHLTITHEEKKEFFKTLEIPIGNRLITMVSRLAPQKDPLAFIYAAAILKKIFPDLSFLLVGDGPLMNDCRRIVRKMNLSDEVKLLGWRTDYKTLLQISDVFVNPSLWEGLPFILLEAMMYEKSVVATPATGTRDVIKDGENGFLVPFRSPKLLADKIKWILDNPDIAMKVGKEAKKTVEHNYNLEKTIPMTEDFYLRLFNKKIQ
ncbi:MAG TPA: glycosyltransferase family 4 protein [Thermodesulfobacteriota bacterium]|nr:glycosyltransferase family 4 protein [Thermodesulfobacteriota bacterium]